MNPARRGTPSHDLKPWLIWAVRLMWILLAITSALVSLNAVVNSSSMAVPMAFSDWTAVQYRAAVAQLGLGASTLDVLSLMFNLVQVAAYLGFGVLLFLARKGDPWLLMVSAMLVGFPASNGALVAQLPPLLSGPAAVAQLMDISLFYLFVYLFPNGHFVPRWTQWPTLIGAGLMVFQFASAGTPLTLPVVAWLFISVPFQIYRYLRVSNAIERQQTRVALAGIGAFIIGAGIIGWLLLSVVLPQVVPTLAAKDATTFYYVLAGDFWTHLCTTLLPISIGVAVLRYHMWDIDLLIRRTMTYGVLTALLALFYLGSVVVLQQLFRATTGAAGEFAIILSTLAIAGLFNPLRRRVQETIDRRFYRRKYDAQQVLAQFGATARDEVDLGRLTDELLVVVEETMRPANVSLWLKEASSRRGTQG